ncbi:nicotinate-nucleotide adenylyltransferase [Paenibacillus lemnae]|uniref:Probable nicotinate-nucleotide adenylyltransferase n=1 Tax=Paenibacillus lemnae TaxID=1330551 RepID=A0A848M3Q0_PAELE|nr:nicotinate-nucleotide adenylyltransferase [Paenibacillus lemnae]NMO94879.1 nicotinate-nucleotide adenylyltransferase [Paenibacillus lemnae]
MKTGIMGGTFDPIHIGHLMAAEAARDACGLEEVWFMPSHTPPHKQQAGVTGEMRLDMTEKAISSNPHFRLLDVEVKRQGVSYTVDTIRDLKKEWPEHDFHFIIGADMVNYLPKWNRIQELADMLSFIGLNRPGSPLDTEQLPDFLKRRVHIVDMPMLDISSSDIRHKAENGESIRYMVPDPVYEYISRSGIYGVQSGTAD